MGRNRSVEQHQRIEAMKAMRKGGATLEEIGQCFDNLSSERVRQLIDSMPSPTSALRKRVDPTTPEDWQEAMDMAALVLHLPGALRYGLFGGGPKINIERCKEILALGNDAGYKPKPLHELIRTYLTISADASRERL